MTFKALYQDAFTSIFKAKVEHQSFHFFSGVETFLFLPSHSVSSYIFSPKKIEYDPLICKIEGLTGCFDIKPNPGINLSLVFNKIKRQFFVRIPNTLPFGRLRRGSHWNSGE